MKRIAFDDRVFLYEIKSHSCGDYGIDTCYTTEFYSSEVETKMVKKYWLFGELVSQNKYEHLFTLDCDITNSKYNKDEIRIKLRRQLGLISRKEEIKKGEII